ncbi:MAG: stage V sporulation protein AC [Clostridiales bacterium]|jgi:stage V sporulation protein AC|nr:stage V sporulation protein AC [Clostridiales bacterium]
MEIKKMSNEQYKNYVSKIAPKSKFGKNIVCAFVIGGLICVAGEAIFAIMVNNGVDEKLARTISTMVFIFLGALFTAIGWFDKIAKRAGAGTLVPITGFANSITAPAMEFKSEGFIFGVGAKMFNIAGPVILYGTMTSIAIGLAYYIFKMYGVA